MYRNELKQNVKIILSINYNVWLYLEPFENNVYTKYSSLNHCVNVIHRLFLNFAGFLSSKIVSYKFCFFKNRECDNRNMLLRFLNVMFKYNE